MIMNIITDETNIYEGDLDDLIIIVEENLKEYILQKHALDEDSDLTSDSDEELDVR